MAPQTNSRPKKRESKAARNFLFRLLAICLVLVLSGCGGGSSIQAPAADFSIAASPATLSITAGATGASTSVTITGSNNFAATTSVLVSGLPTGVTASPASFTLAPGASQAVLFTAAASAVPATATVLFIGTAGALTHTASAQLTIVAAPPPDFSIALAPASLSLTAGAAGQQTTVSATALNSFTGSIAVSISGLPAGVTAAPASFPLTPGTPQAVTLTADANAAAATTSVSVAASAGALQHTATLALTVAAAGPTAVDATTYHYDNARTGLNPNETILTPANVNSTTFGKLNLLATDGKVDAEPLYLSAVMINGQTHNVLYIVTEHDSIYAFDADQGTQLWTTSALPSGETTSDSHNCGQITPEIGITATPVIDRHQGANGVLFFVAMSKDGGGAYHQRLHALDVTTGAEITGSPTEITARYPGTGDNSSNGNVVFDPGQYAERAALLLSNSTLYLAWTSHCDHRPYTGWVMGYSESTLQQTQVLNLTPNGSEGAIWMSSAGLAADGSDNLYLLDANGTLDSAFDANGFPAGGDYGNAIVKLSSTGGKLAVADYFETWNSDAESAADVDLGSGGVLLLPDQTDASGAVRHLLVGAGKDKNIYIGDRDNLGKFSPVDNSQLYQQLSAALPGGVWAMPAYFNNTVYYASVGDVLRAFPINNAKLASTPSSTSATKFAYPGATPSISSNGVTNGIVWAVESGTGAAAVLHAYDAGNLAHELYNSSQAANSRDSFGAGNKFITPMIVNGKVYVGTPTGVAVFGLLP